MSRVIEENSGARFEITIEEDDLMNVISDCLEECKGMGLAHPKEREEVAIRLTQACALFFSHRLLLGSMRTITGG